MGALLTTCCKHKSNDNHRESTHLDNSTTFNPDKPNYNGNENVSNSSLRSDRLASRQPSVSLIDPQSFEFVDALNFKSEDKSLAVKRMSLGGWLAGGIFPNRARKSSSKKTKSSSISFNGQTVKMLMCGAGESGKTTVVKQMKIIHKTGFENSELVDFRRQIYRNIHESLIQIFDSMDFTEIIRDPQTLQAVWTIRRQFKSKPVNENFNHPEDLSKCQFGEVTKLPEDYLAAVNYLWVEVIRANFDKILQKSYILDSAPYFFDELDRIGQDGYVPTTEDILRARITTTGINNYTFKSGLLSVEMIDVGGQRPERRKWIETFDNVTTLMFCVAISEYDQCLLEDKRQNRLLESFQLWESVVNSKWFQKSTIVLFLNKKDVFRHKLTLNPLEKYFPDFSPPPAPPTSDLYFEKAANFIKEKFLALNYGKLPIYTYLVCATDTRNVKLVFSAVKETLLANNLRDAGIF